MTFKSGLRYGALHVHNLERIYGKFFIAFIYCMIRYLLFSTAQKIDIDINKLLRRLNSLEVIRYTVCTYPHQEEKIFVNYYLCREIREILCAFSISLLLATDNYKLGSQPNIYGTVLEIK